MKRLFLAMALSCGILSCETLNNLPISTGITQAEAGQGIKEALDFGVGRGINFLNKEDGFFGSQAY
ncbi:MAG: DUF4197 domain-containing protein, partial [Bacteroidota bacterium]